MLKNSGVAFSPDSDPKDGAKGYILVCHCWVYLCCPRKMRQNGQLPNIGSQFYIYFSVVLT